MAIFGQNTSKRRLFSAESSTSFYQNSSRNQKIKYSALAACMNSFLMGFHFNMTPSTLVNFKNKISASGLSYAANIIFLGAILGCFIPSLLRYNLKTHIIVSLIFFTVGQTILTVVFSLIQKNHIPFIIAGQFFIGLGMGNTCTTVPQYLFHLATYGRKGMFGFLFYIAFIKGLSLAKFLDLYLQENWIPLVSNIIIITHVLLILAYIPILNVKNIRLKAIEGILHLFRLKEAKRSITLAILLQTAQQIAGFTIYKNLLQNIDNIQKPSGTVPDKNSTADQLHKCLIDFSKNILENVTFLSSRISIMLIYLIALFFGFLGMFSVEKLGRKRLILLSVLLCNITIIFLMFKKALFLSYVSYVAVFAFGLGPISWLILPEIFPDEYQTAGMIISGLTSVIISCILSLIFPLVAEQMLKNIFAITGMCLSVIFFTIIFFMADTAGNISRFQ
ncbi:Major Facilitator Superfamily (MFS) [Pseudoloma neurophilia]|uniref:Major Facilitator Superfamily (MFS) n=1 Tax=Pseudoloma neurophilia TaxID=146866 RepID=A0A0R0M3V8_9MICR|nr:Major Facilitator Superfamily (MFS) [Pseudoloma neurophilia]